MSDKEETDAVVELEVSMMKYLLLGEDSDKSTRIADSLRSVPNLQFSNAILQLAA